MSLVDFSLSIPSTATLQSYCFTRNVLLADECNNLGKSFLIDQIDPSNGWESLGKSYKK